MVVSALLMNAVCFGVTYSFGILYVAILQEFPGTESQTAWIMSINMGILMLFSPLTILLCRRLTPRVVSCFGLLLGGLALYLSSNATNIATLYFTFGIMHGIATSFCYVAPLTVIRTNFKRFLDLACGISGAGVGVGGCTYSIFLPGLIETYGWRGALRICSYILLGVTVCSAILVQRKDNRDKETASKPEKAKLLRRKSLRKAVELGSSSPWRNKAFVVLNIALQLGGFVTAIPYCHIVNFAIKQGLGKASASTLSVFISVGSIVGRLLIGKLTGLCGMTRIFLLQAIFLILAVSMTMCPLATTSATLITFACVFGAVDGGFNILLAVAVDDVFTDKKQALKALGYLFSMFCFPYIFGSPLAGWLYQMTQSYHTVFYMCGVIYFIASCLMSLVRCLQPHPRSHASHEVVPSSPTRSTSHSLLPRAVPDPVQNRLIKSTTCSLLDLPVELYFRGEGGSRLVVPDTDMLVYDSVPVNSYPIHSHSINIRDSSLTFHNEYTDIAEQISGFNRQVKNIEVGVKGDFHNIGCHYDVTKNGMLNDVTKYDVTKYDVTGNDVTMLLDNDIMEIGIIGDGVTSGDVTNVTVNEVVLASEDCVDNGYVSSPSTTQNEASDHFSSIQSTPDSTYGSFDGIPDITMEELSSDIKPLFNTEDTVTDFTSDEVK